MTFIQAYTLLVVFFLVLSLYREWFNPAATFFISAMALLLAQVITPQELLKGLSNQQIIIIFLLVLVTAGVRTIVGRELFANLFHHHLSPKRFLLRMMVFVSCISAFLNNTPVVAFMIPYVKDWADKTGNASSKFLIPLSFATILGGMITVIGTSTNLVLQGLVASYNLPLLNFLDFLYLGIIVTVCGIIYLYVVGYHLLPSNNERIDSLRQNLKEYIVETVIAQDSRLVGKSVKDAGLRKLQDLFLIEILRSHEVISPVSPDEILEEGDLLFFAGHTESIYRLVQDDNGLQLLESSHLEFKEQFGFVEAVVPSGSDLLGVKIKDSDFRNRFNASIVAIHRDGKRVSGKVGEIPLEGGDFLLLLANDQTANQFSDKDLFFLSVPKKIQSPRPKWYVWAGGASFIILLLGISGITPLFTTCLILLTLMIFTRILTATEIRRNLDLSLFVVLVCSLAIGMALEKSGTAQLIAGALIHTVQAWGAVAALSALFVVTIMLTSLISNAAAVSIAFPIAMSMAEQMNLAYTPFFVAIAFAASGDFMTPIGYQTNLMVYGSGSYSFRDFVRVGAPLTVLYSFLCILYISIYYNLY